MTKIKRSLALITVFGFISFVIGANVDDVSLKETWEQYKAKFGKTYANTSEEQFRFGVWIKNVDYIKRHNLMEDLGFQTFRLGLNQFADLTNAEYQRLTARKINTNVTDDVDKLLSLKVISQPDSVDWRKQGVVTPIRDQGKCGSCWAFASSAALESNFAISKGTLNVLSPQNLIDCSWNEGNRGCYGGLPSFAFQYIVDNGGIDTEATYPYQDEESDKCKFNLNSIGASMKSFEKIPKGSETELQSVVASIGPVAIGMDNTYPSFQLYKSGVYYEERCTTWNLGHAMTVVGYGATSDNVQYWIVKNSFGTQWGESGYVRMSRNRNNNCGIATDASYPII